VFDRLHCDLFEHGLGDAGHHLSKYRFGYRYRLPNR
jgi:hypothetical protein